MSLPAPNLDNRTFEQIVEEAKGLIPHYCKEWTDFNESDPGITLIHLLAWMTEMTIYRLNLVPNKNYIKFLELLGASLGPPQSAKTWLVFDVTKPGEMISLKPGTKVSTTEMGGEKITFETVDPLHLTSSRIIKVCSQYQGRYADHSSLTNDQEAHEVPIFFGKREIPHILYLGDSKLIPVGENISIELHAKLLVESLLGLTIEWECWDGDQWNIIIPSKDETSGFGKNGRIIFKSFPKMEKKEIKQISTFWLRARLENVEGEVIPEIEALERTIAESGLLPEKGYMQTTIKVDDKEILYFPEINFSGIFYPFGSNPKENDTFYVGSRAFFGKNARIQITVNMAEPYASLEYESVRDSVSELHIRWEYFSKNTTAEEGNWRLLGTSYPENEILLGEHNFKDDTKAFTHSKKKGTISFTCPEDIALHAIQGEENFWIRALITKGNYGTNEKTNPPLIRAFSIAYTTQLRSFDHYLTYNYFSYDNLTPLVIKKKPFAPFKIISEDAPSFYLAFDESLSRNGKDRRIYFRLSEEGATSSSIFWEYFSEEVWKELRLIRDTTRNLSQKGAIEFIIPDDWTISGMFEKEGYWMRARWETGSYSTPPRLNGVHPNAVEARHTEAGRNEILGTSTGEPYQSFTFIKPPILPEPKIVVRELDNPSEEEVRRFREKLKEDFKQESSEGLVKNLEKRLREDVIESIDPDTKKITAVWIRWQEVENFFKSVPRSRHYTFDPYTGVITFGNGNKGMIPPIGRDNIKAQVCYRGGGAKGNVGKVKLTVLEDGSTSAKVKNPDPAAGGADVETIEEAKLRGPWLLKHRYRAVTKEDFEKLTLQASREVAKALCFMETEGEIRLIIIPKGKQKKLLPKSMLIQKVREYLDERRLITAKIMVTGPDYRDISIDAEVIPELQRTDSLSIIKAKIEEDLRQFFHPLTGGPKAEGWPMGRAVHMSELYYLLEDVEGVDYVKSITLDGNARIDRIEIGRKEFPYLKKIDVDMITG